MLTLPRGPV